MWDFCLILEQDIGHKKYSYSKSWIFVFNSKLDYHSYQQQVCKFLV